MSNLIEAVHWTKIQKLKQYIKGISLFKLMLLYKPLLTWEDICVKMVMKTLFDNISKK